MSKVVVVVVVVVQQHVGMDCLWIRELGRKGPDGGEPAGPFYRDSVLHNCNSKDLRVDLMDGLRNKRDSIIMLHPIKNFSNGKSTQTKSEPLN